MNLRETNFTLKVNYEDIKPFEEKVLSSGLCDFAIPMTFYNHKNERNITYDCSGYSSIRDIKPTTTNEVFEIIEKTIITLNKTREFLIRPSKLTLTVDTVYYNMKYKDVKIAVVPCHEEVTIKKIVDFIIQLEAFANEETKEYINCLVKNIDSKNSNMKDMLIYIREQRRVLHNCGL
ncbi:MAG: DUF6382 domain-containing protein [Bacilli bacterium]